MRIATALSDLPDPSAAVTALGRGLDVEGRGLPDFVALHYTAGMDAAGLLAAARRDFPGVALHAGSSCAGVASEAGLILGSGCGVVALAIWDGAGAYGVGAQPCGSDARAAGRAATEAALAAAGRAGEAPDLVWLTPSPGAEGEILAGIRDVVGRGTVIVGGTAGGPDFTQGWSMFSEAGVMTAGVVVSALFTSGPVAGICRGGYGTTGRKGIATRVSGRLLHEIDGRPASEVYREWAGDLFETAMDCATDVRARSSLFPLGVEVGAVVASVPFHDLLHPARIHPDGAIEFYGDLRAGQVLWQMCGTVEAMIERSGRIAARAREDAEAAQSGTLMCRGPIGREAARLAPRGADAGIAGALVVYCAGCMQAVGARMSDAVAAINEALGGAPFLCIFTFGEQASVLGARARHGNLLISCTCLT